ncbi:ATP-binding protein [Brevundimonas sp.]|uniref:ATP-binding protein n=1 Tax=Brevundimonas sp. TaxID=1871086 RepID=UPI0025F8902F|nr:ATP-binding protein [Brevundimonas sp.]
MQVLQWLGFDDGFDLTAPHTRRKLWGRLALGLAVSVILAQSLPITHVLAWFTVMLGAESLLALSISRERMARSPVFFRCVRLVASVCNASGWTFGAVLLLQAQSVASSVIALSLLAGIAVYAIGSCFRTPIHMIACGVPPALGLLVLPWLLEAPLAEKAAMEAAMLLLVGFGAGTAVNAVVAHKRLRLGSAAVKEHRRKAEAANRAKTTFLANMSHEIRTPLNGVVAMAQMLGQRPLDVEAREMVGTIRESGETLERLLTDLLDLARIDAGKLAIEHIDFNLGDTVRSTVALYEAQACAKQTNLGVKIAREADGAFIGDPIRVRQIVANFVSNAVKFTTGGEIVVEVASSADGVKLTVSDTGIGFDPAQCSSIFGRFEQADGTITRRYGGSGLGLSICAELATLMEGEVGCESVPGRGSCFWARLPLPPSRAPMSSKKESVNTTAPHGLRILLADDHPVNRRVVEVMLAPTGCDLVQVEDGAAAVAAAEREAFDVILMDMQMPVMDGLTATKEIRAREGAQGRKRTPILMLTANALPEHVEAGRGAGADGHLSKPLRIEDLHLAINSAVSSEQDPPARAA